MKRRRAGRTTGCARVQNRTAIFGATLVLAGPVHAIGIETGNDDVQIRWDNTVRYNLARRVQEQDDKIIASLNNNDGDRNFSKDSIVSNRLDLLSEFDLVYRQAHGFRLSAAVWGDEAYNHLDDHSAAGSNHLVGGVPSTGLSREAKRFNRGISGEWLDVFAFTRVDIGDAPLYLKAGQHTVYWGESLLAAGVANGIAYAQSPLDLAKALSIPGVEAKELFRPLTNISANFQATYELSLAAQYFLDWKPFRYPEAGSYLGSLDMALEGGESLYTPLGLLQRLDDVEPSKSGEFGLSARWSPQWMDATVGFYYRRFADKQPAVVLDARGIPPIGGTPGMPVGYRFSYGDDIDLYGVSLSKNVGGVSVGAELSYRENMPLASDPVIVASATTVALAQAGTPGLEAFANARTSLPGDGDTGAARGNTVHAVFNVLGQVAGTRWFDSFSWLAELTWNTWTKVTQHEELFKGRRGYDGIDRATKNAWTLAVNLEPKWYQAWPGVDIVLPVNYSTGLSGNSAVILGGNEHASSFSVGIGADVRDRYRFDLKYVGFAGDIDASNPAAAVGNGPQAMSRDRGMVVFNFKTTF